MSLSEQPILQNGYPDGDSSGPRVHALDYLIVLARYRRSIMTIVLGGLALVTAYVLIMPQRFSASAVLLPPEKSEGVSMMNLLTSGGSNFDLKALSQNQSAEVFARMLMSRSLGDSLTRRLNLLERFELDSNQSPLAIDEILMGLDITTDKQGTITIEYEAETGYLPSDSAQREAAEFSAKVVNSAIEVLDKLNQQKNITRARRSREFLGVQKKRKRAELDSIQGALQDFQQKHRAIAIDKQLDASIEALVETEAQVQKVELEIQRAESDMNPDSRLVQGLRSQLSMLKERRLRLEAGESGPEALGIALKNVPELTREYANLKLGLELNTQMYSFLETQYNQEAVQEARETPTVNILDAAKPPIRRSWPRRSLLLAVSGLVLAIVTVLGVLVYDALRRGWRRQESSRALLLRETLRSKQSNVNINEG